jgi:hypothetical protein
MIFVVLEWFFFFLFLISFRCVSCILIDIHEDVHLIEQVCNDFRRFEDALALIKWPHMRADLVELHHCFEEVNLI